MIDAKPAIFPLFNMRADCIVYRCEIGAKGGHMSQTGLQKLAFFVLVALIFYVSFTGGS